jgi:CO/xanthine dehydrogenase FAD-binding subunit
MNSIRTINTFKYVAPASLSGALRILNIEKDVKILAGGTDILVQMKYGLCHPSLVLDVKKISELNKLEWSKSKGLLVGSAVPLTRFLELKLPKEFDVLRQACSVIGSVQIRNRATMGGNICNAAPSADSALPLLCLEANAIIASDGEKRTIPLNEFFLAPGKTALNNNEILIGIEIPAPPEHSAGCFLRHTTREEMDIAVVGVASFLTLVPKTNKIKQSRIALGAVAPTPLRAVAAENVLTGKPLIKQLIEEAAEKAAAEARPISDVRGSLAYRRELVRVLTMRTLKECCRELGAVIE